MLLRAERQLMPSLGRCTTDAAVCRKKYAPTIGINTVYWGGLFLLAKPGAHVCQYRDRRADSCSPSCSVFSLPRQRRLCEQVPFAARPLRQCFDYCVFGTLGGWGRALSLPATSGQEEAAHWDPKIAERLHFLSSRLQPCRNSPTRRKG